MLKIYRKVIRIDNTGPQPRIESFPRDTSTGGKLSKLLTVPAMIAGALVGTLVFSAFFALLLIPLAIIGGRFWWKLRKLKNAQPTGDSLEGEYTVVSDISEKSDQN